MAPRKPPGTVGRLAVPGSRRWEHWRRHLAAVLAVEVEHVTDAQVRAALTEGRLYSGHIRTTREQTDGPNV